METRTACRLDSPLGVLWIVVDEAGALRRVDFDGGRGAPADEAEQERQHAARGVALRRVGPDDPLVAPVTRALTAYFAGSLRAFDLAVAPEGTAFQRRVWEELGRIPYGETRTYAELARSVGRPGAARAVGAANGANPISVVLPCHRVVGSGGALTGYGGGIERKRALLALEAGLLV